jgi:GTP-binding protein
MLDEALKAELKAELKKNVAAIFIYSAEIGLQELKDKLWKMLN